MSMPKDNFDRELGFTKSDPVRDALHINPAGTPESASLGYETSDVGIRGIIVFLAVLAASLAVFFVVCFALGKLINHELVKRDGPPTIWTQQQYGPQSAKKREDMVSNPAMAQQQLALMTRKFPEPRLQMDDGNRDTADLHAREDLLLEHYTYVDKNAGTIRIPIERAMELIVQRGIGSSAGNAAAPAMASAGPDQSPTSGKPLAGERPVVVTAPLTDGFARTGPEQDWDTERLEQLESREAMQERQQAAK